MHECRRKARSIMRTNQFFAGDVVRSHPDSFGRFHVYRVIGHIFNMLELEELGDSVCRTAFQKDLELYEYTCNSGTYRIGDRVRLFGMEGEWTVLHFNHNRQVICENEQGRRTSYAAHFVKKF